MMLAERLEKVLRPDSGIVDKPSPSVPMDATPVSPMASRLMDDQRTIDRAIQRVCDLIDRCEV